MFFENGKFNGTAHTYVTISEDPCYNPIFEVTLCRE